MARTPRIYAYLINRGSAGTFKDSCLSPSADTSTVEKEQQLKRWQPCLDGYHCLVLLDGRLFVNYGIATAPRRNLCSIAVMSVMSTAASTSRNDGSQSLCICQNLSFDFSPAWLVTYEVQNLPVVLVPAPSRTLSLRAGFDRHRREATSQPLQVLDQRCEPYVTHLYQKDLKSSICRKDITMLLTKYSLSRIRFSLQVNPTL